MNKEQLTNKIVRIIIPLLMVACLMLTVISCNNLLDVSEQPAIGNGKTGYFVLNIGSARTIKPTVMEFAAYDLVFTPRAGGLPVVIIVDDVNKPIELPVAAYDLEVKAYLANATEPTAKGQLENIVIAAGIITSGNVVTLSVITGEGTGFFKWNISFPAQVTEANMTITKTGESTPFKTLVFKADGSYGADPVNNSSTEGEELSAGNYLVTLKASNGTREAGFTEDLHIYRGMDSVLTQIFIDGHFTGRFVVTTEADSGAGSLRQAVADANASDNSIIYIDRATVNTITLTSTRLEITKNMIIEGNGATITSSRNPSNETVTLYINTAAAAAKVSSLHFKDGRSLNVSPAIYILAGTLILESCIFSDNLITGIGSSNSGAIYNSGGNLTVRGCTFINNSAQGSAGAIFNALGSINLFGNLFLGNTGTWPVMYQFNSSVTSGYNITDVPIGTSSGQSGFAMATGNANMFDTGFSMATVMPSEPLENFPQFDFHGNLRQWPGKPGAINFGYTDGYNYYPFIIDIKDISGVVRPVGGHAPVTEPVQTRQYAGTVAWYTGTAPNLILFTGDTFESGVVYTALIQITSVTNHFTYAGLPSNYFNIVHANNVSFNAETGIITAVFPETVTPSVKVSRNNEPQIDFINLPDALEYIRTTGAGNYIVTLSEDQGIDTFTLSAAGIHITLIGDGGIKTITHTSTVNSDTMFTVSNASSSLTLDENITLQGRTPVRNMPLVRTTNGTITMKEGSRITGFISSSANNNTGTVNVNGANAHFVMQGGSIDGNRNNSATTNTIATGGVNVLLGSFTMEGGSIIGNFHGALNTGIPSDVYIQPTVSERFNLSGTAAIGTVKLLANNATDNSRITIPSQWTGTIAVLDLRSNITGTNVKDWWLNKTILDGAGLNANIVGQITNLGSFFSSTPNTTATEAIIGYIIGTEGEDLGKLIAVQ